MFVRKLVGGNASNPPIELESPCCINVSYERRIDSKSSRLRFFYDKKNPNKWYISFSLESSESITFYYPTNERHHENLPQDFISSLSDDLDPWSVIFPYKKSVINYLLPKLLTQYGQANLSFLNEYHSYRKDKTFYIMPDEFKKEKNLHIIFDLLARESVNHQNSEQKQNLIFNLLIIYHAKYIEEAELKSLLGNNGFMTSTGQFDFKNILKKLNINPYEANDFEDLFNQSLLDLLNEYHMNIDDTIYFLMTWEASLQQEINNYKMWSDFTLVVQALLLVLGFIACIIGFELLLFGLDLPLILIWFFIHGFVCIPAVGELGENILTRHSEGLSNFNASKDQEKADIQELLRKSNSNISEITKESLEKVWQQFGNNLSALEERKLNSQVSEDDDCFADFNFQF